MDKRNDIIQALLCKRDNRCDKCPFQPECVDGTLCYDLVLDLIADLEGRMFAYKQKSDEYDELINDFTNDLIKRVAKVVLKNE